MTSACRDQLSRFFAIVDMECKGDFKVSDIFSMGFKEWAECVGGTLREYARAKLHMDFPHMATMMIVIKDYVKDSEGEN